MGGQPTRDKLGLPLPTFPQDMLDKMNSTMVKEDWEVKKTEEDLIIENAEVSCYLMLISKAQMAGGTFQNAADTLSLNMQDESKMIDWIKNNTSNMLTQLWPEIQSSTGVTG
jgi:ferritin-like metal-binding protein YciE